MVPECVPALRNQSAEPAREKDRFVINKDFLLLRAHVPLAREQEKSSQPPVWIAKGMGKSGRRAH
jgi:hypothetical protein